MSSFSIGVSGLQVNQNVLNLIGQNIANADTPNYHRQVAELEEVAAGTSTGLGVAIKGIRRVVDRALEDAVIRNNSASAGNASLLESLTQLQSYLDPAEGSLHDALVSFFTAAERLSTAPDDLTQRSVVLSQANRLADQLNTSVDDLSRLRSQLVDAARSSIAQVNALTDHIAQLNSQIHDGASGGQGVNSLMDLRDQAIAELSQLVNVRVIPQDFGQVNVLVAGTPVILNSSAIPLQSRIDSSGNLLVTVGNSQEPLTVEGGALAGQLALHNNILPMVRGQFDALIGGLVRDIDQIHASGLGLGGPFTSMTSLRTVDNTGVPLAVSGLHFAPKAGDLYITVTDQATGQRSLSKVQIDPATQSLSDIATAISAIPNLQAVVDPRAGTLNFIARPGYAFDFTGNLSTKPDAQAMTGSATATIAGRYNGPLNDVLDFRVVGSGAVGLTTNLALEVRNGAGALISTLNIGQGYEPGTDLPDVLGVRIAIAPGTLNNNDSFQVNVAATPDTAGILPALGLNSFFVSDDAGGVRVRQDLLDHPDRMALSISGQPGDASNLNKIVALGNQNTMQAGTQTFSQFLASLIAGVGNQVQDAGQRDGAHKSLGAQLEKQLQSVIGIDPNEELIKLVQFQRSYAMSARYLSIVSQTLDQLLQIGR